MNGKHEKPQKKSIKIIRAIMTLFIVIVFLVASAIIFLASYYLYALNRKTDTEVQQIEYASQTTETISEPEATPQFSPTTPFFNEENAKQHGYVVIRNGDVRHNQISWQCFVDLAEAGEEAAVTVMHYTHNESNMTYIRYGVIFDGNIYTLKIESESQQNIYHFTSLEKAVGKHDQQTNGNDSYIRYTLTGGTNTPDVIIFTDLFATPKFAETISIALHLKEVDPPLAIYDEPAVVESVLNLLENAEYLMVPPDDYILGVKLILRTQDDQEMMLEVDLIQGIFRYKNSFYRYGEQSDLFHVLGISQWPEEIKYEYSSYLSFSSCEE